jgi:glucan phosphorylase
VKKKERNKKLAARRQELTTQEVDLKKKLLDLMHAKKLTEYKRNGISVKLVAETETVKVRVRAEEEGDDTPADPGPASSPNVSAESLAVHAEG